MEQRETIYASGTNIAKERQRSPVRTRVSAVAKFLDEAICKGRKMRCVGKDDLEYVYAQPQVYDGFLPTQGANDPDLVSVTPCIVVIPGVTDHASRETHGDLGLCNIRILFVTYFPGDQSPEDEDEQTNTASGGLWILLDWMEEAKEALCAAASIEGCDMTLAMREGKPLIKSSVMTENESTLDTRPFFMGYVDASFLIPPMHFATREKIRKLLD